MVFCQKHANGIANSEFSRSSLIWVCTVCPDLYVRKCRIITVNRKFKQHINNKVIRIKVIFMSKLFSQSFILLTAPFNINQHAKCHAQLSCV